MNEPDRTNVEVTRVLPNGPDVLGVVNEHVVGNFRAGGASDLALLSAWRMAKLVVEEPAPLTLSTYQLVEP